MNGVWSESAVAAVGLSTNEDVGSTTTANCVA